MPRPTQAQGRPGSLVIPDRWAAGHQPVADKTMHSAACELRGTGTTQTWNPVSRQMETTAQAAYYTGGCRIQSLARDARITIQAEDPEVVADYLIVVPATVGQVVEGHLVTISDSHDDALTGRTLTVRKVVRGSQRFERDLFCQLTD